MAIKTWYYLTNKIRYLQLLYNHNDVKAEVINKSRLIKNSITIFIY